MITMGMGQVRMRTKELMREVQRSSVEPLLQCAALVEREAKRLLSTGAALRIGPRGGKHYTPSAEGQPPHARTRALMQSISHAKLGMDKAIVGATARERGFPYGKVHEHGSRMHPQRPFMHPALSHSQREFPRKFRNLKLRRIW